MTKLRKQSSPSRDPLSLAQAPLQDLIAAILAPETLAEVESAVPPRANQIARLIASEAVRLIRLGTQAEIVDAANDLAQAMLGKRADRLEQNHPDAYDLVNGAAVALDTAAAPSSSGAEQTVLRSWKGRTMEIIARLNDAPGRAMRRSDLLDALRFGEAAESSMSHILTSMEAAGLIVRVRHGRNVMVHLGPTGREEHVQEALTTYMDSSRRRTDEERFKLVRQTLEALIERNLKTVVGEDIRRVDGCGEFVHQIQTRSRVASGDAVTIHPAGEGDEVTCQIRIGDSDSLLCKVHLADGELTRVRTYSPTDERQPARPSRRLTGPSLLGDMLESYKLGGGETRVQDLSAQEALNNLDDPGLSGVGDAERPVFSFSYYDYDDAA